MEQMLKDLRFTFRMLRKNPGFATVAILILALGIGANAAIFSLVDSVLIRPLPFPDQERLVMLRDLPRPNIVGHLSYLKFMAWRDHTDIFDQVAAFMFVSPALSGTGEPEQLRAMKVSSNFLPLLGASVQYGRNFLPEEELSQGPPSVILSNDFWRSRFNAAPSAVGQKLILDDRTFTIVGVLPASFQYGNDPQVVLPLRFDLNTTPPTLGVLRVIGKFVKGLDVSRGSAAVQAALPEVQKRVNNPAGIAVIPLQEFLIGDSRPLLLLLLGTVAFVLLIACANTANLLLARAAAREKEIAVRVSLGAARARIVQQLLTESILLAILGGVLGLVMAFSGLRLLSALLADRLPRTASVHMDMRMLAFTAVLCVLTGIIFGLAPSLQMSTRNLQQRLKIGGRQSSGASGMSRLRHVLVILEMAFSLVLLAGAGLLLRSFVRLVNVDKGFDSDHVLTMHFKPSQVKYPDAQAQWGYLQQILQRTQALPGVQSSSFIMILPLTGDSLSGGTAIEGQPADRDHLVDAHKQLITNNYFQTMHIPLVQGRYFEDRDSADSTRVVIIDQNYARRVFGNENPVGKHIDMIFGRQGFSEIIGVVRNAKEEALAAPLHPTVYAPLAQRSEVIKILPFFTLVVRTNADPLLQVQAVTNKIHELDANQAIADVRTMDDVVNLSLAPRRAPMWLFGTFSAISLLLATIGIYGVLSFYVLQRQQDIGVRMALGAQRRDVMRLVLGHALKLVVVGVLVGLGVAFAASKTMTSLLFDIRPTDFPTFLAVSLLLGIVALAASGLPALRATRVDPLKVLRDE